MPADAFWNPELETMAWSKVESWQQPWLDEFVRRLPARSPFYAGHLGDKARNVRAFEALAELPFTVKDQLRAAQGESSEASPLGRNQGAPQREIVQLLSSSGTTGEPMYYALTAADQASWTETIAQTFFTAGLRADDTIAHLVGTPIFAGGLPYADGFRRIGATLAWLGGLPTDKIMAAIPCLRATAVLATTSFGTYLAERFEAEPSLRLGVRKFMSGGEPGLGQPEIRAKIARGWGLSDIREVMGLGDVMAAVWSECEAQDGMHFNGQRSVAVELIDPQTGARLSWQEGAAGEAVYTTFAREATPVLRYRSADHLHVVGMGCSCGRTSPRIRCVGRTDDMLIYKGMNVFPTAIRDVVVAAFPDKLEPHLRIWKQARRQVRFDDPIPVEIEHRAGLETVALEGLAHDIEEKVRARLQVRLTVSLVAPGTLPRSSYKTALVQVRESV